jgi:hypothetical protein
MAIFQELKIFLFQKIYFLHFPFWESEDYSFAIISRI